MIILILKLKDNVVAIYDKTALEPFVMVNEKHYSAELVNKIKNSLKQNGVIYCIG